MKKWFLFLIVPAMVLFAGLGWARTFNTPVIDGYIGTDWDPDCEVFETETFEGADYTLWLTWDSLAVYLGIDRDPNPNNKYLGDNAGDLSMFVAIDTDPPTVPSGGFTADGYQRVTFSGGHLPDYYYAYAGGGGWYEWAIWNGVSFDWQGWYGDVYNYYGWADPGDSLLDDEVTIYWDSTGHDNGLNNPLGIAVYVWITNEGPGDQAVLGSWPALNPTGDEPDPDFIWAYEFYYNHYYCSPGVPAPCHQPACNICPNLTDISVPVILSSFTATGREGSIEVAWTSQTEVNAFAYHLLRSEKADGQFVEVARLDASGNSETPRDYRYLDEDVVAGRTYYYMLVDEDYEGNMKYHGPVFASAGARPMAYSLSPNYPNPFNPSTAIGYEIPEAGRVTLAIYNVLGQEVRSLVDAHQEAGNHTVMWDSKDNAGHYLNSGVYFYTLKAGDFTQTRKMVLMR
ncbi:MAG: hypothetical protein AMJ92_07735 [candidate division Zixibacteria bacterium SM23_81]|nr:MAG: hypothetical protein AMJ92_07735 [candidate division Zixibacteria bacterium SM23_81]